jgi:two-component system, NarL family, sensor histidine kinase UhpB
LSALGRHSTVLHNVGSMLIRLLSCLPLLWALLGPAQAQVAITADSAPAPANAATAEAGGRIILNTAMSVESDEASFPSHLVARTVPLPDVWELARPDAQGPVWYRMNVPMPTPVAGSWSLWIERACGHMDLQLNGQSLLITGPMKQPMAPLCNQGQLVQLPAALLREGPNTLDIKLAGRPLETVGSAERAAGLSAVLVDPSRRPHLLADAQRLGMAGTALAASAGLLFLGAFLITQGWQNRRESHLAYFGVLLISLGLIESPRWLPEWSRNGTAIELLLAGLWALTTWAGVQFMLRHAGRKERWADWLLPLQCLAMPLSLALIGPQHLNLGVRVWGAVFALELVVAVVMNLLWLRSGSARSFWTMCVVLVLLLGGSLATYVGLHAELSWLLAAGHLVAPAVLGLLGLRLVQQRRRALESAEASRLLLEQRVSEVKADIEANYRQLSELRVTQVTDRERKRIAADLHDDLGAKLLTIVHTSESERISTLAREALEEMRLSVRGLTGKPVRLEDALGDWRAEVISRLGQASIEAVWNMPSDALPQTLPARAFVQTTRIIREAVNNIIKHSGASQCAVRCQVAEGDFQLVIQDNGKGIAEVVDGRLDRGHGLSSMKGRAKQLQGQCLVESGPGYGTVIRLTVPLETAAQTA